jgi:uncharacterized protein YbjT (DUF2867 family)
MKVLVTGATGFVGREVLRQVMAAGHTARIIARNPDRARLSVRAAGSSPLGVPALAAPPSQGTQADRLQPEPQTGLPDILPGNMLQPESLCGTADGCDAVIHLVGIISEIGDQTFENVHVRATQNVLAEARRAGAKRWIQMSALGARPNARSRYHQTKWAAEEAVRASGLDWTIFRPSIIYGPGDGFVSLFARMSRWSPVLPVMGNGQNRFQPVAVENVARCFVGALTEPAGVGKTFDVCGPEQLTFDEVLDAILRATYRKRWKLHVPMPVARLQATLLEMIFPLLLRQAPPLHRDQLLMLQEDNVGNGCPAAELFKLEAGRFDDGIQSYLKPDT